MPNARANPKWYIPECSCEHCYSWRYYRAKYSYNQNEYLEWKRSNVFLPIKARYRCKVCKHNHGTRRFPVGRANGWVCPSCFYAGILARCIECERIGHFDPGRQDILIRNQNEVAFLSGNVRWHEAGFDRRERYRDYYKVYKAICNDCVSTSESFNCYCCGRDRLTKLDGNRTINPIEYDHDDEAYFFLDVEERVCDECVTDRYLVCQQCQRRVPTEHLRPVNRRRNTGYNPHRIFPLYNTMSWCSVCTSSAAERGVELECCNDCNQFFVFAYGDLNLPRHCPRCGRSAIRHYSYRPHWHFFFIPNRERSRHTVFFGAELELSLANNSMDVDAGATELTNGTNEAIGHEFVYCKRDASVHNGFELVTHPFSWEWLSQNEKPLRQMFDLCGSLDLLGTHPSCGMHVHISKSRLRSIQMFKLASLLYNNNDLLTFVAERKGRRLDMFAGTKDDKGILIQKARHMKEQHRIQNIGYRHVAVNFQPRETIEVRIFQGVHEYPKFRKNIEFVQSALDFCRLYGMADMRPQIYKSYIGDKARTYPFLHEHLKGFVERKGAV